MSDLPVQTIQRLFRYPDTRTVDIADNGHGVRLPDPYRSLEVADDPETAAWIDGQNVRY